MALSDCLEKTGFKEVDVINGYIEEYVQEGNTQEIAEQLALQKYGEMLEEELLDVTNNEKNSDTQIKSAISNDGSYSPNNPDIRFQKTPPQNANDNFYSNSLRAIDRIPQNKGTFEQWKAMLLKNGASQAELDWIGFEPNNVGNRLTKEQVVEFISNNRVEIEEVVKGEPGLTDEQREEAEREIKYEALKSYAEENNLYHDDRGADGYNYLINEESNETVAEGFIDDLDSELSLDYDFDELDNQFEGEENTKYSQYTLPGGENYKELLLTMPSKALSRINSRLNELQRKEDNGTLTPSENQEYEDLVDQYRNSGGRDQYKSGHWDEQNILSHIRFNERTVGDEKILFIEEVQSDWAQEGRKKGFKGVSKLPFPDKVLEAAVSGGMNRDQARKDIEFLLEDPTGTESRPTSDQWSRLNNAIGYDSEIDLNEIFHDLPSDFRMAESEKIPNMPFKQTPQWLNLSMKRMIRYAAENGFDRVAWVTGEQSAERYDLSKQIDVIYYNKDSNSLFAGHMADGVFDYSKPYVEKNLRVEELEEHIGKEAAQKISDSPDKRVLLEGQDLKVGGEGMKSFYNKIVPNTTSKLLKKLDKNSKVEVVMINKSEPLTKEKTKVRFFQNDQQYVLADKPGTIHAKLSKGAVEGMSENDIHNELITLANRYSPYLNGSNQLSFPITPIMRTKALSEGMPMFQKTPIVEDSPSIEKQRGDNLRRSIQDRYVMLKRLQEGKQGDQTLDEYNAYVKENLQFGKANEKERKYEERIWTPMSFHLRKLIKGGVTYDEVSRYLKAKHIVEDNIEAGGIPVEEAQNLVNEMNDKVNQKDLDKLHKFIKDMQMMSLNLQYESGIISKKQYDKMKNEFTFYVPLRGFNDVMEFDPTKFTGNHNRKGRSSESGDPISYLEQMIKTDIIKGEQNKVKLAFLNFMKNNPDSRLYTIQNVWYLKQEDGSYKVTDEVPTKEQIDSGEATRQPDIDSLDADQMRKLSEHALLQSADMAMTVLENGRRVRIQFRGPDGEALVRAFKGTKLDKSNAIFRALTAFNTKLRQLYTQYSPEFALRNFLRDSISGLMNINADYGPMTAMQVAKYVPKAMQTVSRGLDTVTKKNRVFRDEDGAYFKEYLEQGAMTGYSSMKELSDVYKNKKREIEGIKSNQLYKSGEVILDFIDAQNSVIENTVRFSAYRTLRKKGVSPQKAAIYAKDLTVNFNRKGEMTSSLNSLFLFFNAGVQGIDRLTRPYLSKSRSVKARAVGNVAAAAGFTYALVLEAIIMGGEDEDGVPYYYKLPEYTRTHNMVFAVGENKFVTIPLPYGHNLPFALTALVTDPEMTTKDKALMMVSAGMETFSPVGAPDIQNRTLFEAGAEMITPTFVKPLFVDIPQNKNFAGIPIYNEPFSKNAPKKPSSQMYFESVNPTLKYIAQELNSLSGGSTQESGWIDWNPEIMEHLITSYSGGVGSFLNNSYTTIANIAHAEDVLEGDKKRKIPFYRNYFTESSDYYDQSRFYQILDDVKKRVDIYKGYMNEGDIENAKRYFNENKIYFKINGGLPVKRKGRWKNPGGIEKYKDIAKDIKDKIRVQESLGNKKEVEKLEERLKKVHQDVYKAVNE